MQNWERAIFRANQCEDPSRFELFHFINILTMESYIPRHFPSTKEG